MLADPYPLIFPVNYRLVELPDGQTPGHTWIAIRTRPGNTIDRAPVSCPSRSTGSTGSTEVAGPSLSPARCTKSIAARRSSASGSTRIRGWTSTAIAGWSSTRLASPVAAWGQSSWSGRFLRRRISDRDWSLRSRLGARLMTTSLSRLTATPTTLHSGARSGERWRRQLGPSGSVQVDVVAGQCSTLPASRAFARVPSVTPAAASYAWVRITWSAFLLPAWK